ncbi:hypothetical protein METBIDRAFT_32048 [Metschnikowia bicuspidata var. bicuspidata NRRL YB-4993]|uniref:Ribonucleoside-diphosphate reductase n=1 Tax=Metschnikowia bicuspidata var. bicuspidata NRRL YB-4993 TaxID=869754 RepID=A0A1A0HCC9_9ASCO|nr:hypothetical protein METBIDRAFT_32048 [Metschnikowia bicuspidata var. bicuspidata NRRL YB-4993]OBA21537.1 hypothetical protein METBIDRAFT_32048 [Metschnikowia bicuspidata var. bicuspidata NRRL YB-4993]
MAYVTGGHVTRGPFARARLARMLSRLLARLDIPDLAIERSISNIEAALPDEISVDELLGLVAESLALRVTEEPLFADLAGMVEALRVRRKVPLLFAQNFQCLYDYVHPKTGTEYPLVAAAANAFVQKHAELLDRAIAAERDFHLSFFGMRTLSSSYLLKRNGVVAETPQYLFMRVAVGIHGVAPESGPESALAKVKETYEAMSSKHFVHSSPTLFNAATENNYLSLCFLVAMDDDSIDGIYKALHKAALILKGTGGIGIHMHDIRSKGSLIKSSNGTSNGLVPMLRVFNNTARYVDQGGNKRPGAIAVYLEPWHGDIQEVLDLRKNHGQEELRARDLFYALWIPDLFMQRVESDALWSLFSPSEAPGLADVYGEEFLALYEKHEAAGLACRTMPARKLWLQILETQIETGMPFMLYKDACNRKLNQKNLGTIKSSNLCCEIVEYSSRGETAVCNLGLLALPSYIRLSGGLLTFDFVKLHAYTKILARNLDKVIDVTLYLLEDARESNFKHRPIAIGVQGLADVFMELRLPFESPEAQALNRQIFETIYHGAVEASLEMAMELGSYSSFAGSPASEGKLQFDLWNHKPEFFDDWDQLKSKVMVHGLRNSLLVAPMPTASTSQILGFNECFEPYTSNLYLRRVLSGEYQVVNKYLIQDLKALGIWNTAVKQKIVIDNGLIQNILVIPDDLKALYKTVWEVSQKSIVNMAADRGCFIDQLQSMNIFMKNPSIGALTSCHFYAWKKGLKTGMYYLRSQAASRAIQFTVDEQETEEALTAMTKPDTQKLMRRAYIPQMEFSRQYDEMSVKDGKHTSKRVREADPPFPGPSSPKSVTQTHKIPRVASNAEANGHELRITKKGHKAPLEREPARKFREQENDIHDIFDPTPRVCQINYAGACDSCSG